MKTDLFGKDLKINDYVVTSIYGQTMAGKIYKFTEKTIGLVVIPNTKQKWTPFTTKTLNEVVVIGYGTAKKNDLTGSVTAFKPTAFSSLTRFSIDLFSNFKKINLSLTINQMYQLFIYCCFPHIHNYS